MKHRLLASLALAAALTGPALAQDKPITLRISLWVPPAHPLVQSAKDWGASMEKASGGTIKGMVFPSEQLGKAFDHYDMVRDGIADVGYINPGYQPGRFPIMNASALPFVVANAKSGSAAVDAWYRKYAVKEMADTHFCLAFVHDPGTFHSRKKLVAPSDIKGLKVRPAGAVVGEMVTLLGGTNVQASAPEARDAIERGVADAITFPWNSIFLFGIDKVTKYSIDVPLYTSPFVWSINKGTYDGASPAQKKVIDEHCTNEWATKLSASWTDFEFVGRDKMRKAPGHEIVELTPKQLDDWKAAVMPLTARWAETVKKAGLEPDAVLGELKAELKARDAAF
jgi:TRAP-type C4-dicarboxylate transport system substrate-binding protein